MENSKLSLSTDEEMSFQDLWHLLHLRRHHMFLSKKVFKEETLVDTITEEVYIRKG